MEQTASWDRVDVNNTQDPNNEQDDRNDNEEIPGDDFNSVAHVKIGRGLCFVIERYNWTNGFYKL